MFALVTFNGAKALGLARRCQASPFYPASDRVKEREKHRCRAPALARGHGCVSRPSRVPLAGRGLPLIN